MINTTIVKDSEYEVTYWNKNDFEKVEGGVLIRVGNRSYVKRESIINIINKEREWRTLNEVKEEKHIVLGLNRN